MVSRCVALVLSGLAVAACGGGGPSGVAPHPRDDLVVLDVGLDGYDGVALNSPIEILCSAPLDPRFVRPDTVRIRSGRGFGVQSFGDLRVSGERLTFHPRVPSLANLSDAGLRPGADHRIVLDGLQTRAGQVLRRTVTARFRTAGQGDPGLFTDRAYLDTPPPTVVTSVPVDGAMDVHPESPLVVVLDRVPLDPRTVTRGTVTLHQVERKGRPEHRPVPGSPQLEQSRASVRLHFQPDDVLEGFSRYELRVHRDVTDLTGRHEVARSPMSAPASDPDTVLTFTTGERAPRPHHLTLEFDGTDRDEAGGPGIDMAATSASFNDNVPGAVAANLVAAGGIGERGDFLPKEDTLLSTSSSGAVGGVFAFRDIRIPEGVTVTLTGPLPASLLAAGDVVVEGTILANGGRGEAGESPRDSLLPAARGGAPGPGGGIGGESYTGTDWRGSSGGSGAPDGSERSSGGRGGVESGSARGGFGGGGGGGGGAGSAGNDGTRGAYPTRSSWNGTGGSGGAAATLLDVSGMDQGRAFVDAVAAGGGGGAGGNSHYYPNSRAWMNGAASGGGGGGAVLLRSAGSLRVSGNVLARGGDGGDAGAGGVTDYGGAAGGGGGGGTIALLGASLDVTGSTLDTSGGDGGGTSGRGWVGSGGDGGGGHVVLADADGTIVGLSDAELLPDFFEGRYDPRSRAGDPPSVFTSTWFDTGVRDPVLQPLSPPDLVRFLPPGSRIRCEIQVAPEDPSRPGRALASAATPWATVADSGSGNSDAPPHLPDHRFVRLRLTLTPAESTGFGDPLPHVDRVTLRMTW
ncbi:MAG: Ig-like domain-containing domain [Planctomycetota bacterium]|jgi:hypothetical protein